MGLADIIAQRTGHEAIALPWLMLPGLIFGGMILVFFVHPDPKEIGMHLERYYPDYMPPPRLPRGQEARIQLLGPVPQGADAACDHFQLPPGRATWRSSWC